MAPALVLGLCLLLGLVLGGGLLGSQIVYEFGGLNALGPDMITEATRNARASANRFAADSGSKGGAIRSANQGVFSISASEPGNAASAGEEGGGGEAQADASMMKRVRVLSTIDCYLENQGAGDRERCLREELDMCRRLRNGWFAAVVMGISAVSAGAEAASPELVRPSLADKGVRQYDDPSVVLSRGQVDRGAPLAIFLAGTGGHAETGPRRLLDVIAGQGYRVINLTYDNTPAVNQVCPRSPNPRCAFNFREMRTFGDGTGPVSNPPAEAIEQRLVALLRYLDHEHPDAGWGEYLGAAGRPAWNRILVSGLSQGAGMAAFLAKRYPVYRVVLFSSPWDTSGADQHPAPWLSGPSATPPNRWWAERHAREKTTALLANAYEALRIPADHILIFDGGLPENRQTEQGNPYHGSTVSMPQYADKWRQLYGHPEVSGSASE